MIGTSMMGDLGGGFGGLALDVGPPQSAQQKRIARDKVVAGIPTAGVEEVVTSTPVNKPSFRERRAARPSFRERRMPRRAQRQAYRQAGGRPMMDWIIGGDWGKKADRRSFLKNAAMNIAGIMNPALRMPIMGYQMYEGMKDLDPSKRRQYLAMNLMRGPLGRRFGPGASALGGIMALRQGAPRRSILSNLLAANAPRGYRDIAGGIASMMSDTSGKRTWGQTARNVGMGRTYGYLAQQFGNQLYKRGVDPQFIPIMASSMARKATQGVGSIFPGGPGKP